MNTLYYGDNLNILRHALSEPGAVATGFPLCDLVNLDPPFNSNRRSARLSNRNVLFKDESGLEADSLEWLSKTRGIGRVRRRPITISSHD